MRGYCGGGYLGKVPDTSGTPFYGKQIQVISFITDGNSTDIGDLTTRHRGASGCSSSTHGYVIGGVDYTTITGASINRLERFSFASATSANATDWADMTSNQRGSTPSASSATHGFTLGGKNVSGGNLGTTDVIDKFPFASQTNATDWADATVAKNGGAGCSSITHGYSLGGVNWDVSLGNVETNQIEKYPFASQTNSVDVADITLTRQGPAGVSSCDDAYAVGGMTVGTNPGNSAPLWDRTTIDKHSFASGGNSTSHGDLPLESSAGAHTGAGMSGITHGYHAGGIYSHNIHNHQYSREQIEKFSYASNVTASDVGDLVQVGTSITPNFGMAGPCSNLQF